MLVNLYSAKTPITVFSLPLLIALLAVPIFLIPIEETTYFWDWQNLLVNLVKKKPITNFAATVLMVSVIAHQINVVFNQNSFYSKASYLPGLIYVLSLFSLRQLEFSTDLLAQLFIIIALGNFLKLKRQDGAKTIMFWGGLFLGLAIIFSAFSVALILLPWICLAVFRPFVWREWLLVLFGILMPIFYYVSILYMVRGGFDFKVAESISPENVEHDLASVSVLGVFGLIVLASLFKYFSVLRSQINRFKKQSLIIFHFLWIAIGMWVAGYYLYGHIYMSFIIPIAFLVGTAFLHAKRIAVTNLVVIIWLIISAANIFLER
jgi:hypothetical protein